MFFVGQIDVFEWLGLPPSSKLWLVFKDGAITEEDQY
jgi:hypothetical protein